MAQRTMKLPDIGDKVRGIIEFAPRSHPGAAPGVDLRKNCKNGWSACGIANSTTTSGPTAAHLYVGLEELLSAATVLESIAGKMRVNRKSTTHGGFVLLRKECPAPTASSDDSSISL